MSACAQTFVRTSVTVTRTSGSRSRSLATRAFTRVMSAEAWSWKTGICHASVRRRAIVLRMFERGTRSSSPVGAGVGATDVLGHDPAVGAGAADPGELDAALPRHAARERRRLDPPVAGRDRRLLRRLLRRRGLRLARSRLFLGLLLGRRGRSDLGNVLA